MCEICANSHNHLFTNTQGTQYTYVVNNDRLMTSDGKPYWFYAHSEPTPKTNKAQSVKVDPTRQAGNRRRAIADIRKRLKGAQEEVLAIIDDLPYTTRTVNQSMITNRTEYIYELSADRVASIDALIRQIVNGWFETAPDERPPRFFFDTYIQTASQSAATESANRIAMLAEQAGYSAQVLTALQTENVLMSTPYRRRLQLLYGRAFNEMKGFSGQTGSDLARVLADVVALGRSPREAQRRIRERFSVADSRARRIAHTEINHAYTQTRLEEMKSAREDLDIAVKVIHRSALLPTTRPWHAARHGRLYTIEEQQEFWATGANSIFCYCSASEAVLDGNGIPYDMGLIKRLKKEREGFVGSR